MSAVAAFTRIVTDRTELRRHAGVAVNAGTTLHYTTKRPLLPLALYCSGKSDTYWHVTKPAHSTPAAT